MPKASSLLDKLREKNLKLVTAESCTGGLIGATITQVPGSSEIYERGFITYSNEAKIELLGVSPETIKNFGAVSRQTAEEMARGALCNTKADIAVSATGIAGPKGDENKPVGLVYIGVCYQDKLRVIEHHFSGTRLEIQAETVTRAFELIEAVIK